LEAVASSATSASVLTKDAGFLLLDLARAHGQHLKVAYALLRTCDRACARLHQYQHPFLLSEIIKQLLVYFNTYVLSQQQVREDAATVQLFYQFAAVAFSLPALAAGPASVAASASSASSASSIPTSLPLPSNASFASAESGASLLHAIRRSPFSISLSDLTVTSANLSLSYCHVDQSSHPS
jgi:hypothetical protein